MPQGHPAKIYSTHLIALVQTDALKGFQSWILLLTNALQRQQPNHPARYQHACGALTSVSALFQEAKTLAS